MATLPPGDLRKISLWLGVDQIETLKRLAQATRSSQSVQARQLIQEALAARAQRATGEEAAARERSQALHDGPRAGDGEA